MVHVRDELRAMNVRGRRDETLSEVKRGNEKNTSVIKTTEAIPGVMNISEQGVNLTTAVALTVLLFTFGLNKIRSSQCEFHKLSSGLPLIGRKDDTAHFI